MSFLTSRVSFFICKIGMLTFKVVGMADCNKIYSAPGYSRCLVNSLIVTAFPAPSCSTSTPSPNTQPHKSCLASLPLLRPLRNAFLMSISVHSVRILPHGRPPVRNNPFAGLQSPIHVIFPADDQLAVF